MDRYRTGIGFAIMLAAFVSIAPAMAQSPDQGMRSSSPGEGQGVKTGRGPLNQPVGPAPNMLYPRNSDSGTNMVPGPVRTQPPKNPFGTNPNR